MKYAPEVQSQYRSSHSKPSVYETNTRFKINLQKYHAVENQRFSF